LKPSGFVEEEGRQRGFIVRIVEIEWFYGEKSGNRVFSW
jgi:hypothetical protein